MTARTSWALGLGLLLGAAACGRASSTAPPAPSASAAPLDRLSPDELQPGSDSAYGLALPRGMRVVSRTDGQVYAVGPVSPESLANYVRERVAVRHVELGAARTVFPAARILGGDEKVVYRIEVIPQRRDTVLVVRDLSPRPPSSAKSDEERWREAGHSPEGKPLGHLE